jgi:hypothetical protein
VRPFTDDGISTTYSPAIAPNILKTSFLHNIFVAGDDTEDFPGQEERRENINDPHSLTGAKFPSYVDALQKCLSVIESDTFEANDIIELFVKHRIQIGGVIRQGVHMPLTSRNKDIRAICLYIHIVIWLIICFREKPVNATSFD